MKKILAVLLVLFICSPLKAQILGKSDLIVYEGFYDFYYEESTDKIYLKVEDLNKEFLYINSLASGVGSNDIGLDRGKLGQQRVVYFKKAGNKLLLVQPNLKFRANTENALERKSVEQAFAMSVLSGFNILEELNDAYIIDLTSFLLEDANSIISVLKQRKEGAFTLDRSKSALALERTKAFPKNVEFEALLTFKGQPTGKELRAVSPTASLISVVQHHSFVKLPDEGYEPRKFDPRSGAISMSYMDYAAPIQEDIKKRFIRRHRLEKKNPDEAISEAKEPIIYYLDPGTPEPVRSALLEGASWWNEAFEAIGFKDAFQVKLLPEGADPMDCRFNVIQWVHRSTRGWSYGASVVDPRTGEIIKGHVSLGSLRIRQDYLIAQALMKTPFAESDENFDPMLALALARIRQLSAHEVGHTLGFTHNFAASTNNRASVMDYPHPLVRALGQNNDFSEVYDTGIGDWDKVTVAYSYSEFNSNEEEEKQLRSILSEAFKRGLRFISDYDARAQNGAHAFAHLWDNGKAPAEELENVMKVRQNAIASFSEDNIRSHDPYTVLEDVFVPLYFFHRYQLEAAVKVVGGLDYSYATKGDGQKIVESIGPDIQKNTLKQILESCTAVNLAIPTDKLRLFPPRAYGYGKTRESFQGRTGVGFDPLSAASTASDFAFKLLLDPERMNRVVLQSSLDKNQLSLDAVLDNIISFGFKSYEKDPYLKSVQHEVNTNILKYIMNLALHNKSYFETKAIANAALNELHDNLKSGSLDIYRQEYIRTIESYKKAPHKFVLVNAPRIPDGSPIGTSNCSYYPN